MDGGNRELVLVPKSLCLTFFENGQFVNSRNSASESSYSREMFIDPLQQYIFEMINCYMYSVRWMTGIYYVVRLQWQAR
jgi:hypothetical protein